MDQAEKSRGGDKNNKENTQFFKDFWDNGKNKLLLGAEITTIHTESVLGGVVERTYHVQMDQVLIAVCEKAKKAFIVNIDGTTTFRGERVSTKANEGATVQYNLKEMEELVLTQYPHLSGYEFIHICGVMLPDHLDPKLKNLAKEERNATKFCVRVNYKTEGKYITDEYKNGMDFAMRQGEFLAALNEMVDNEDDYILDKNTLAYIWIKQKGDNFYYMPRLVLNDESAMTRREHLIYCIQQDVDHYAANPPKSEPNTDKISIFLRNHGVQMPKKTNCAMKAQKVVEYLLNNYPKQTEMTLLAAVERQNEQLRRLGRA